MREFPTLKAMEQMTSNEDTGQETLELILWGTKLPIAPGTMRVKPWLAWKKKTAKEILDAGFRLIPTLGTIAQVDELPLGTVIQDDSGNVYRRAEGIYYDGPHEWQSFDGDFWDIDAFVFPVKVIAHGAYSKG